MSGRGVGGTPSRPLDTHSVAGRRVRRRPRAPHVLALGCPHRTHLRGPAAPLPVVRGFDDHHRVRHPSRSRPFHPQLSRFPHPTPATLSGSRSTPGHVHVRSNRRVRPHRSGTHPRLGVGAVRFPLPIHAFDRLVVASPHGEPAPWSGVSLAGRMSRLTLAACCTPKGCLNPLSVIRWLVYIVGGVGTLLAAFGHELWIALTTAIVTAVTSYLGNQQVESIVVKYSQAAVDLGNVKAWWAALGPEAQSPAGSRRRVGGPDRDGPDAGAFAVGQADGVGRYGAW